MKIVILGGGPCGLGAAWRLAELGHEDWLLFEKNDHWGGLSASFQDQAGFWWDLGGHVLFSHYRYFDQVMDDLLGEKEGWVFHKREAWIHMQERFIPYPLQNNIHHLPKEIYWECLAGIIDIQGNNGRRPPAHFGQWIEATFGKGLAKWFLEPYNYKVWAYPPDQMDWSWVGERVAPVDLKQILHNSLFQKDDTAWGPNAFFRFPRNGATGEIWRRVAERLPAQKCFLDSEVRQIDIRKQEITFSNGRKETYDALLNTAPLTDLLAMSDIGETNPLPLKSSATHVVGLALKRPMPDNLAEKCWIYFPESNSPFYRVTVFSNYSPNNVPDKETHWSLMCEVSQSPLKPVNPETVVDDVIQGAINCGLMESRRQVDHTWRAFLPKGYPTPSLDRNTHLLPLLTRLEENRIYSRGRFGAWRYEVGNMDHSFMQGVEFANRMAADGEELTLWYPQIVNADHPGGGKRR